MLAPDLMLSGSLAVLLVASASVLSARRVAFGIGLIFCGIYFKAFFAGEFALSFGGVALYPLDGFFLPVATGAATRVIVSHRISRRHLYWILFGIALFGSFAVGFRAFGAAAGVPFRKFFYFFAVAFYLGSCAGDYRALDKILRAWLIASALVLVSLIPRWIVDPVDLGLSWMRANSEETIRVIPSDLALMLGNAAIIALMWEGAPKWSRSLVMPWLAAVVVLQHRSVWLATAFGVAAAFGLGIATPNARTVLTQLAVAGVLFCIIAVGMPLTGVVDASSLVASLEESWLNAVHLETTAGERLNSWQVLLQMWRDGGPTAWLFGSPFGTSLQREVLSAAGQLREIEYGAHNAYIEILFYSGALGLTAFLVVCAKLLSALYRQRSLARDRQVTSVLLIILIAMQMIYYVPYGVEFALSVWLGAAMILCAPRMATGSTSHAYG